MFADAVGSDASHYYWVRFVNVLDDKGPYNQTSGTLGETAPDLAYVFSQLTAAYGGGTAAPFFQLNTPTVVGGVTIPAGTYMKQAMIYDGVITNAKIGTAAVDSAKIATAAITTAKIADANITNAKIGNLAVDTAQIAATAITTAKIADANITTAKISNLAVTTAKIGTAAVDSAQIASAAITTAKIGSAAITTAKIADANITSAKILDANITTAKIQDAAVDTLKIAGRAVTLPSGAFTAGSFAWSNTIHTFQTLAVTNPNSFAVDYFITFGVSCSMDRSIWQAPSALWAALDVGSTRVYGWVPWSTSNIPWATSGSAGTIVSVPASTSVTLTAYLQAYPILAGGYISHRWIHAIGMQR
jgi:hypothetical protein